ncbi:hypothetical protein ACGFSI_34580 [Streptomyces virginiae]|uniref:hypothetical protein n=1 Tax=Streptomyces virginiae TaxID=1961 RepID=UPI00370FD9D4
MCLPKILGRECHAPRIVTGDALTGHPDGTPLDRILCTFGVRQIPAPWITQAHPGGRITVPYGTHYSSRDALLRLTVHADGTASGPFVTGLGFMKARAHRPTWPDHTAYVTTWPGTTGTTLRPDQLADTDALHALSLTAPTSRTPSTPRTTATRPAGGTPSPTTRGHSRAGPTPKRRASSTSTGPASCGPPLSPHTSGGRNKDAPLFPGSASPSPPTVLHHGWTNPATRCPGPAGGRRSTPWTAATPRSNRPAATRSRRGRPSGSGAGNPTTGSPAPVA